METLKIIAFISLIFFLSCKKEKPELASPNELTYQTFSEHFVCQPVTYENSVVGIINQNNVHFLCAYDRDGNKLWQQHIDAYTINGYTFQTVGSVKLIKDKQNDLLILMQATVPNATTSGTTQRIKVAKFDQSGQILSQLADTIHRQDTIVMNVDTISFVGKPAFKTIGFVSFSTGNYAVISSQIATNKDSTYLQLSYYNANAQFVSDKFLVLPGKRNFSSVYSTSDNHLFFYGATASGTRFYLMIDLTAKILFETPPAGVVDPLFFYENRDGNYVVSTATIDNTSTLTGIVACLGKTGNVLWSNRYDFSPSWIILSVQEQTDGYLFSGFTTDVTLTAGIDWRTYFLQGEHHAIVQKTDFTGIEQWHFDMGGTFLSAGAAALGGTSISFFGGKYDQPLSNIFLLKLNSDGTIQN